VQHAHRRRRGKATEDLILRTIAAHADSLLRTARRHSLCPDDAQDAYQRALEIFMTHAERLDGGNAAGWLHVVVKHEAQAIRRSRQKLVATEDPNLDVHEARSLPTSDERLETLDLVSRAAEALQRLKPQELRALWLKAEGHSYNEIAEITGWSYTKVNRCLTEGRRSFLSRYATIESGGECDRWLPVLSALVDGETTPDALMELRPHLRNCPGCRATLGALQGSSKPLAMVLPIPLLAAGASSGEHLTSSLARLCEMIAGGVHDRAGPAIMKVQAVIEATATGKAAAIAGAAAAVAGGGYATMERSIASLGAHHPVKVHTTMSPDSSLGSAETPSFDNHSGALVRRAPTTASGPRNEFQAIAVGGRRSTAPEFGSRYERASVATTSKLMPAHSAHELQSSSPEQRPAAPEFASESVPSGSPEFRP
jgi:RNA polymerase sigma factor (sigma-70 family)